MSTDFCLFDMSNGEFRIFLFMYVNWFLCHMEVTDNGKKEKSCKEEENCEKEKKKKIA